MCWVDESVREVEVEGVLSVVSVFGGDVSALGGDGSVCGAGVCVCEGAMSVCEGTVNEVCVCEGACDASVCGQETRRVR